MAVQTTYTTTHEPGFEGAVVDGQLKNIMSAVAAAAIPFGRFVTRGAVGGTAELPNSSADVTSGLLGVAIRTQHDVANASDVLQYEDEKDVSILDFGVVYMRTEDAVSDGDDVFVRFASGGGGTALGSVRSDADSITAIAAPGCKFLEDAGAGALVRVQVRLSA